MKKICTLAAILIITAQLATARIWRVNNIASVTANFTDPNTAAASVSVMAGDTLHIEPSPNAYSTIYLSKQLVIIGEGYLLDPANNGNSGLQSQINGSAIGGIYFYAGASGSKLIGITLNYYPSMAADSANNITLEKCAMYGFDANSQHTRGLTIRKCLISGPMYFNNGATAGATIENCITLSALYASNFTTGCVIRNCTMDGASGYISNCYLANNLINAYSISITNAIVKNNFFSNTPSLPAGAVNNQFNVALSSLCTLTGSNDAKYMLKSGSPALGAGVTLAAYTPDCGAFGGPDPYKLSGIPGIPSIYLFTVPASIPLNTPSMNVTISTRNNN